MRKLISNSTNIALTSKETKKVVAKAVALSVLGLGITAASFGSMVRSLH